jgi:CelD/BcsL family acetyltransferase involved in cellulose biosynthesis
VTDVRVRVATTTEEIAPHAEAWDRLAERAAEPSHVASHAYVGSQLDHREDRRPWTALLAFAGRALVGVLVLLAEPVEAALGRLVRLATPPALATQESDALVDPAWADPTYRALFRAIDRRWPTRTSLALGGVRAGSPTRSVAMRGGGGWASERDDGAGRRLVVAGSLEAWRANLGANLRRNLRKAHNRTAESGAAYRILRGGDARPALVEDFLALEASGWKGREGTAILASATGTAFYRDLVARAATRGWLEWHVLSLGGQRPAAMHMAFRLGRTLLLHRIAYDETHARLVPGNLLFDRVVEDAFAGGRTDAVDCMTDMPWHDLWRLDRYPYLRLRLFPRRPLPLLGYLADRLRSRRPTA